jgi:hypothetical protein
MAKMDLGQLARALGLTQPELKALRRAFGDTKSKKPKTKAQHEEDESWLDWGLRNAKKYGPALLELLEAA